MTLLDYAPDVISVTTPAGGTVHLRSPSFSEWHALASAHRSLAATKEDPSAELIAKTIAACVCDPSGKPVASDHQKILKAGHREVMWIYRQCWETVLNTGDDVVGGHEKN